MREYEEDERHLLFHPESDCLFVMSSKRKVNQAIKEGCEDVTGIAEFEDQFKKGKPSMATSSRKSVATEAKKEEIKPASQPYHIKYRPDSLKKVVGQEEVVKSIASMFKKVKAGESHPHTFIFTGPSGSGKTTLARILAKEVGCEPNNIIEVDAASNTGIDAMRAVTETLKYQGFGALPNKLIILDEAHALSKQAWQSLLKSTEEPPPHVYFAICTTEPGKIPDTILTRGPNFTLRPVKNDHIMDLLEMVATDEDLDVPDKILQLVARSCSGSPRQALVMLAMVEGCSDIEEAAILLEAPLENKEVIDLCRLLVQGNLTWKKVQTTLSSLSEMAPESIRIVVVNYLNACLMKSTQEKEICNLLDLQASFSKTCNPTDKLAPILLALGNHVFPPN